MTIMRYLPLLLLVCGCGVSGLRQDSATFREYRDDCNEQLLAKAGGAAATRPAGIEFKVDLEGLEAPSGLDGCRAAWHQPPQLQGLTGQCWAWAATSMLESEAYRVHGRVLKLSETWTVYWEFVEKARLFVRRRGGCEFRRGSEPNAALRVWKDHGVVPEAAYRGLLPGHRIHDDRAIMSELRACLEEARRRSDWDETAVVTRARAILDARMGPPPERLAADGRVMTPAEYLRDVVCVDPDSFVSLMSLAQAPWHSLAEYPVPDNWWHSAEYYNVPLAEFEGAIGGALARGASACIGFDYTEPGYCFREGFAFVPTFDIAPGDINDPARQLRFNAGSTADDHVVHLVGRIDHGGRRWYVAKDSDTSAHNSRHPGYIFHRNDYLRLKTLVAMVPRDVAEQALGRKIP
jgi:bleomycin hydrolase